MNRRKLIALAITGFVALGAVFAAVVGKSTTGCYRTTDGEYICNATGKKMDAPCCPKIDIRLRKSEKLGHYEEFAPGGVGRTNRGL